MAWAPDYATVEELAAFMRISDEADNDVLARAITTASRAVDQATGRQFGQVAAPEPRYYSPEWDRGLRRWSASVDDLQDVTGLEVAYDGVGDGTWGVVDEHVLTPRNAPAKGLPYTRLSVLAGSTTAVGPVADALRVTARWGWTAVPDAVVQATLLQAARIAVRRDSPHGVTGTGPDAPGIRVLSRLDPDVEVALRPYRRSWSAV